MANANLAIVYYSYTIPLPFSDVTLFSNRHLPLIHVAKKETPPSTSSTSTL
jgi:hypothetical protein